MPSTDKRLEEILRKLNSPGAPAPPADKRLEEILGKLRGTPAPTAIDPSQLASAHGQTPPQPTQPGFFADSWEAVKDQFASSKDLFMSAKPESFGGGLAELVTGVAPAKAALGAAGMALSPLAPAANLAENFFRVAGEAGRGVEPLTMTPRGAPGKASLENAAKILNPHTNRPTAGSNEENILASILAAAIPIEAALPMAARLIGLGIKVPPQAAKKVRQFLLAAGPEIGIEGGVMRTGAILGEPGGLPPRQIADIVGTPGPFRATSITTGDLPLGEVISQPAIDTQKAGARLADEMKHFGAVVPKRIFGKSDPFAYQPELTGRNVQKPLTYEEQILNDKMIGFRAEARMARELDERLKTAQIEASTIDPTKVETNRAAQLQPTLPPAQVAAGEQLMKSQLKPVHLAKLDELRTAAGITPEEWPLMLKQMLPEGRTEIKTLKEWQRMAAILQDIKRPVSELNPEIADIAFNKELSGNIFGKGRQAMRIVNQQFLQRMKLTLAALGPEPKRLAFMMEDIDNTADSRTGKAIGRIQDALKPLSRNLHDEVRLFLDKGVVSKNEAVNKAGAAIRDTLDSLGDEAIILKVKEYLSDGSLAPFTKRANYFPHFIKREILTNMKKQRQLIEEGAQHLLDTGQVEGGNLDEARRLMHQYINRHKSLLNHSGSLERAREMNLPEKFYETDLLPVLETYLARAYHRLEEIRRFGPDEPSLIRSQMLATIEGDGEQKLARQIVDIWAGRYEYNPNMVALSAAVRSITAVSRLSIFTGMLNISQATAPVAFRTSVGSMAQGLYKTIAHYEKTKREALESGSIVNNVISQLMAEAGGVKNFASWYLKNLVQLNSTEIGNRVVANAAGQAWATKVAHRFAKDPTNTVYARELRKMNIDPEAVLKTKGVLGSEDLHKAGQSIAKDTQFLTRTTEVPMFANDPVGKMGFQFKHFTMGMARLFNEELGRQMVRATHNPDEAFRFLQNLFKLPMFAVGGAYQLSLTNMRRIGTALFMGRPANDFTTQEDEMYRKLAEYTAGQVFGIYLDVYQGALEGGKLGMYGMILGPGAQFGIDTVDTGIFKLDPVRALHRGAPLVNKFIPPADR